MKKLALFALSVFLILSFVSCGSKKTDEDAAQPTAPEVETIEEVVEQAETIEETVSTAGNELAIAGMDSARDAALEAGADEYYMFDDLEALYAQIKEKADKGEDVTAACADLAKKYQALTTYIKAEELKDKIDEHDIPMLVQSAFDNGCDDFDAFDELSEDENSSGDDLLAKATSAYANFKTVFAALSKELAKDARDDALEAKKDADSVKAGVSQKKEYNRAVDIFKKGDASYSMMGFESALDYYDEAYDIFASLYEDISEKRAAALAAIEAAKKSVEESAAVAQEADLEAPLTGDVDGIEDEDAVLLEEDDYANPEDAEAYLSEDISISFGGDAK